MSEFSWSWTCGTGDGTQITQGILASTFSLTSNLTPSDSGVVYWTETNAGALQGLGITNPIDGLLDASESGGVVTIDTGAAIVTGWLYVSDETTDFNINGNPGAANATDIIALRRDATAGTVRLVRLNGAAGAVASLTQTAATWEIPLWYVALNGAGQFSELYNGRKSNLNSYTYSLSASFSGPIALSPLWNNWKIRGTLQGNTSNTIGIEFNNDNSANSHAFRRWYYDNSFVFQSSSGTFNNIIVQPFANSSSFSMLVDFELDVSYAPTTANVATFATLPRVRWRGHSYFSNTLGASVPDGDFFGMGNYDGQVAISSIKFVSNGGGLNPSFLGDLMITGYNA